MPLGLALSVAAKRPRLVVAATVAPVRSVAATVASGSTIYVLAVAAVATPQAEEAPVPVTARLVTVVAATLLASAAVEVGQAQSPHS